MAERDSNQRSMTLGRRAAGLCAAVLGVGVLGVAGPAHACSRPAPIEFEVDAALQGIDVEPPSPPEGVAGVATRSSGELCRKGICVVSTCGSTGGVRLDFAPSADDSTAEGELGYQLRLVEGVVPAALEQPLDDVAVGSSPLYLDVSYDDVVGLDATFQLVAIDRAGNVSAPSAPFLVSFDGCTRAPGLDGCMEDLEADAVGCSLARAAAGSGLGLGLLALVAGALWRRRCRTLTLSLTLTRRP